MVAIETRSVVDFEREFIRETEDLAYYFAKPLGLSRYEYIGTHLPPFCLQPEQYRGRFDKLVIVQTPQKELPLHRILDIVGVKIRLPQILHQQDWQGDKGNFRTPVIPYVTYMDDGGGNLNKNSSDVRRQLLKDERGGTMLDGVFLYVFDRSILMSRHLPEMPGTQLDFDFGGMELVPRFEYPGEDGAVIFFDSADGSRPNGIFGTIVAGREIAVRNYLEIWRSPNTPFDPRKW